MKKLSLALLSVLFCFSLLSQPSPIAFIDGNPEYARARASAEGKLFVLYFGAGWCMPCQWMEENTFTDVRLQRFMQENALAVKLDIDTPPGRSYQRFHQVKALPALLIFDAQGALLKKYEEALPPDKLLTILQSFNHPVNRRTEVTPIPAPDLTAALPAQPPQAITPTHLPPGEGAVRLSLPKSELLPEIAKPVINTSKTYGSLPVDDPEPELPPLTDPATATPPRPTYGVQLGAFADYDNAQRFLNRLGSRLPEKAEIRTARPNGLPLYRVITGTFGEREKALELLRQLDRQSIRGFVTEIR